MTTKRAAASAPASSVSPPLLNAALILAAVGYGLRLLVLHGRLAWPPTELLGAVFTLSGCLALIGPLLLLRREATEGGLGELVWLTAGLLIWVFDVAAMVRGEFRSTTFATPLSALPMGLTILAVVIAGWRAKGGGRVWTWTNVTGWVLAVFWVGMGLLSLLPGRTLGLAAR